MAPAALEAPVEPVRQSLTRWTQGICSLKEEPSSSSSLKLPIRGRVAGQQLQQGAPDFPFPGHVDQLWRYNLST